MLLLCDFNESVGLCTYTLQLLLAGEALSVPRVVQQSQCWFLLRSLLLLLCFQTIYYLPTLLFSVSVACRCRQNPMVVFLASVHADW